METISSNTLFHFTPKMSYLKSILTEGFLPSYCLENFDTFKFILGDDESEHFEMAVPMVCFCDIPLSRVKSHMNAYGYYGIGLTKDWGITSGVAPLIYASHESATTKALEASLKYFLSHPSFGRSEAMFRQYNNLLRLIRYTKPYQGRFFRKGEYMKYPVTFYNEREWRYVPDVAIRNDRSKLPIQPWLEKEGFLSLKNEKDERGVTWILRFNQMLRMHYSLPFGLEHIRYILVREETEIRPLIKSLRNSKAFPETEIEILSSKILTKQQIFDDL